MRSTGPWARNLIAKKEAARDDLKDLKKQAELIKGKEEDRRRSGKEEVPEGNERRTRTESRSSKDSLLNPCVLP